MSNVFPGIFSVRQLSPESPTIDIRGRLESEFEKVRDKVKPGSSVALAVGSRGITNIAPIVRTFVEILQSAGAQPFIIPAMGSHGGATPQGQADVLAAYGITEEAIGAPIRASLEVKQIGVTDSGLPVVCSVEAMNTDAIFIINRVKPHTDFKGRIGSGLVKMCVIGLGKKEGAAAMHAAASRLGHERVISEMARAIIRAAPIAGGVAILEDQRHATALLEVVPREKIETREETLLEEARQFMPSLPFDEIDLLIVDQIGKNISGSGMDPNITGRWVQGYSSALMREERPAPFIRRIFVRELTPETHGNAIGIGLADVTTARLVQGMNHRATYVNALTSLTPHTAKIPIYFETDRECIEQTLGSLALPSPGQARIVRIRDTLSLDHLEISESLAGEAARNPKLEPSGPLHAMQFDESGRLLPLSSSAPDR